MNKVYVAFLIFFFFPNTPRFVSSHDYTLQGIGFSKNIYVILIAHSRMFAAKKNSKKMQKLSSMSPRGE